MCYIYEDILYWMTYKPVGQGALLCCLDDYIFVCNDVCASHNNKTLLTVLLTYSYWGTFGWPCVKTMKRTTFTVFDGLQPNFIHLLRA